MILNNMDVAMAASSALDSATLNQLSVLAGSLTHMSRYLRSGCPRAAQLSELLLARLDAAPDLPQELLSACHLLQDALWPDGQPASPR